MAPKKTLAYRQNRKALDEALIEQESQSPQSQLSRVLPEVGSSQTLSKKILSTKKISIGRNIDFDFLVEEGFTFGQNIKTLGWNYFYLLDKPTYPDLVKEFYMNLSLEDSGILSIVKNTLIQVNPDILHDELKISVVEHSNIVPSRKESLIVIMENENIDTEKDYFIRYFTPQMRLLHHIVNKIFFFKNEQI